MISLPGGSFVMGSVDRFAYPADGEAPREVEVSPFMIDRYAVSNAQFAEFVTDTGYVTEAERYGWSFVFGGMLPDDFPPTRGVAAAPWWRQVPHADWRRPAGLDPALPELADHPSCTCRSTTRSATAGGRASGCRPRPSGSSRDAEGWPRRRFPGAMS